MTVEETSGSLRFQKIRSRMASPVMKSAIQTGTIKGLDANFQKALHLILFLATALALGATCVTDFLIIGIGAVATFF